jgi:hypothetical protein
MGRRGETLRALPAAACLFAVVFTCAGAAAPARAVAGATYVVGAGGHPFSLVDPNPGVAVMGSPSAQDVRMKTGVVASWGADSYGYIGQGVTDPDPRGVQAMPDGGVLVADAANHLVLRMDTDGQVVWAYTRAQDDQLESPVSARRLDDGTYLIADEDAQRVFIVGLDGGLRWQYGATGVAGSGVGRLDAPTYADVRPDGNITICDAGNHRVIVVRRSDYESGFTASSILWQYGTTGVSGTAAGELARPSSVQWLTLGSAAGNALICDREAGRVIEVRASDYQDDVGDHGFSDASVVWQCLGSGGSDRPSAAAGVYGGDAIVWICDTSSGHVSALATGSAAGTPTGHEVIADYGPGAAGFSGTLSAPCALSLTGEGGVAVADPGESRIAVLGTKLQGATATSRPLTCDRAGRKRFVSITCSFADIPHSSLGIMYQVDGAGWKTLTRPYLSGTPGGTGAEKTITFPLPPKTAGATISYLLSLGQGQRALGPLLASLAIKYVPAGPASGSGGGGEGGDNKGSNGSGTYSYPDSGGGSGQGSGGGAGGGTGSGSGSGAGVGHGSGSSDSPTGADAGAPVAGSATGQDLPSGVDPSAQTAPGNDAVVSGYMMKASGFAGGGEGGGASSREAATAGGWLLLPAGLGLLCLGLFAGAAASQRRRIRVYADFDPARPRALPADHTPPGRPPLPPPIVKPRGWR